MAYPLEQGRIHQRPLAVLASPGRYVQGPGATHELGRELKRLGLADSVLFIAGGTAQRCLGPIWQAELPPLGLTPVIEAFGGECSEAEIDRLVELAKTHTFTAVVGAGGGKASDTARAVANELELPVVITPTLAQLGVNAESDKEIQTIAERAVLPGETIHNEHFEVSADAVACALKAADQQGRAYI